MKPQQRKPQQRAIGPRLVGLPPEPELESKPEAEPVEQEQPEVSPAGEIEIAAETARIEASPDAKEIVSVSCDDDDPDLKEIDLEEIETESGTKIVKKDHAHRENPFGLKSTAHPVVPSSNLNAPYGFDEHDRPIGMPVGKAYVRPVKTGTVERPKGKCKCGRPLCMYCHPEFRAQTEVLLRASPSRFDADDVAIMAGFSARFGPPAKLPISTFVFYPEVLGITRRTLLALFSMTVAIEPQPVRKRVLKSRAMIDKEITDEQSWIARIVELKRLIEASNQIIEGLSAHVMKLRLDPKSPRYAPDNFLDTSTRKKFKREENKKIEAAKQEIETLLRSIRKLPKLDDLKHRASNWGKLATDYELVAVTKDEPVSFENKFVLPPHFEDDHPGQSLETYEAFLRSNDIVMDYAARIRQWPEVDSWRYLENEIVRQAIAWKLVRPSKAAIDKCPDLRGTWSEEDYAQDDTENALIVKTGGAQIGASIYNFGTNASGSTRLSGNFDNTVAYGNKDGRGVHGEARTGSDSWVGDDDADSFDPE
jgi:hypothetical protein